MTIESILRKFLLILFATSLLFVKSAYPQSVREAEQSGIARSIIAIRSDRPPVLDGTLQDVTWKQASTISEFHQREPFEKQLATEKTEVHLLYDRRFLYFGIHCFD